MRFLQPLGICMLPKKLKYLLRGNIPIIGLLYTLIRNRSDNQLLKATIGVFNLHKQIQNHPENPIVVSVFRGFDVGVDFEIGLDDDVAFQAQVHFGLVEAEMPEQAVDPHHLLFL
jgi:hypothetical protein